MVVRANLLRHAARERVRAIRPAVRSVNKPRLNRRIRYEPDDPCPPLVTLGVVFQGVVLILANTVLMATIIVRAAGEGELYLGWAGCRSCAGSSRRGSTSRRTSGSGRCCRCS